MPQQLLDTPQIKSGPHEVDRNSSHEVWFDLDWLKLGVNWERYIDDGACLDLKRWQWPCCFDHDTLLGAAAGRVLPERIGKGHFEESKDYSYHACVVRAPAQQVISLLGLLVQNCHFFGGLRCKLWIPPLSLSIFS
jgi:hypothetical protein